MGVVPHMGLIGAPSYYIRTDLDTHEVWNVSRVTNGLWEQWDRRLQGWTAMSESQAQKWTEYVQRGEMDMDEVPEVKAIAYAAMLR